MDNSSPESHCVFVETTFDTHLVALLHNNDTVSVFKEKICNEHGQCFPEIGEITISALKVEWSGHFYHMSDSMNVKKAFDNRCKDWFISVDAAVRVDKTSMADCSSPNEVLEKKTEITNDHPLKEEYLKTQVAEEKKTKQSSQKKSSGECLKLCGTVEAVVASVCCASDVIGEGKDIEVSEKDGIHIGEDQQTCDEEMLG